MSLLSSFIMDHVVKGLEAQFVAHEPELQMAFVAEVEQALGAVAGWVQSKVSPQAPTEGAAE